MLDCLLCRVLKERNCINGKLKSHYQFPKKMHAVLKIVQGSHEDVHISFQIFFSVVICK
jgi:hypothetical protein